MPEDPARFFPRFTAIRRDKANAIVVWGSGRQRELLLLGPADPRRRDVIVRYVKDDTPDNNGGLQDVGGPNNEVIIEHANGAYFTVYAHLRQGSATVVEGQTVTAGTQLGQVGNAGASSEPHLHFHAFRFDVTGRTTGVPMVIDGMTSLQGAPLSGVPRSGVRYQTP